MDGVRRGRWWFLLVGWLVVYDRYDRYHKLLVGNGGEVIIRYSY